MNKLEFYLESFNNQTTWIQHANTAATIIFALYTAVVGWTLDNVLDNQNFFAFNQDTRSLLVIYLLMASFGLINALRIIFPTLKNPGNPSFWYFGDIASFSADKFKIGISDLTEEGKEDLIISQIHVNAKVAKRKFEFLSRSVYFLSIVIFISILLILFHD